MSVCADSVPEQRVNDLGGLTAGPVDRDEHGVSFFEKRVDALVMLMVSPSIGAFRVDALRRAVEANSAEAYTTLDYYVKWLNALSELLIEQEVIDRDELDARIATIAAAEAGGRFGE
ncbi:SH3-like domain-containing protein [Acuticoccus kandeliae]|uniref:SH3-like domain-containing protein n=1 Tax=Acuticoccus kandeliae TaxID=2073160 RepID=UPI000D3EBEF4